MNGAEIKALMPNLADKALAAEFERAPKAKAAYDTAAAALTTAQTALTALQTAAAALTTALAAEGATIAGCATEIAAVNALLPAPTAG